MCLKVIILQISFNINKSSYVGIWKTETVSPCQ